MARPSLPVPARKAPLILSNALVASATRYGSTQRVWQKTETWQTECYRHYAICGEARFAANFFGHALAKATLHTAKMTPDGPEVTHTGPAADALASLFSGKDGQAQMLKACGIHLTIAGECYLVGRTIRDLDEAREGEEVEIGDEIWEVLSVLEIDVKGRGENQKWYIKYGDGYEDIELDKEDVVIRIWNPNPARRMEADSPFRSLLTILVEIEWLTRHIFAQVSSRLVGSGILFLPQGMTFPPALDAEGNPVEGLNEADAFMRVLGDVMVASMQDNSTAESQVPIIVTAPDDLIDKAQLLHFWSDLDEASMGLRREAIVRFATGMDLPIEQVLGMSSNDGTGGGSSNGVSHWGAWQIEESTIKMHIEPMLDTITNAVTVGYLRPLLPGTPEFITHNTSALKLRPDRSAEAFELFDRGVLSLEALLRENGMDASDAPDDEELKLFFLRKIASGSATPEQVAAALDMLFGVKLPTEGGVEDMRESRPNPSLEDHPERPRTPGESAPPPAPENAALIAASEGLVIRALEKAGNRLLNAGKRGKDRTAPPCAAYEAHTQIEVNGQAAGLLADAWGSAPLVLGGIADPDTVVPVLSSYCMGLYADRAPHSRERLEAWLSERL